MGVPMHPWARSACPLERCKQPRGRPCGRAASGSEGVGEGPCCADSRGVQGALPCPDALAAAEMQQPPAAGGTPGVKRKRRTAGEKRGRTSAAGIPSYSCMTRARVA